MRAPRQEPGKKLDVISLELQGLICSQWPTSVDGHEAFEPGLSCGLDPVCREVVFGWPSAAAQDEHIERGLLAKHGRSGRLAAAAASSACRRAVSRPCPCHCSHSRGVVPFPLCCRGKQEPAVSGSRTNADLDPGCSIGLAYCVLSRASSVRLCGVARTSNCEFQYLSSLSQATVWTEVKPLVSTAAFAEDYLAYRFRSCQHPPLACLLCRPHALLFLSPLRSVCYDTWKPTSKRARLWRTRDKTSIYYIYHSMTASTCPLQGVI
jgi:hypothetical protein